MTIDFKYVPPSPEALSGPAFISQTEQAFNELGQEIDTANTSASEALATARSALTTATDAALTANDAQTLAQNAQDAADAAQATADAAGGKADEALDRANAAYDTAANAESKADAAGGAAETAQNGADTAHQRADEAYSLAENADTTATAARNMASAAMGEYIVVADYVPDGGEDPEPGEPAEPEDADEYFQTAEKLYFTGQNLLNFPLEAPFYFDVHITSDGTSAFQRAFTGDAVWSRWASLEEVTDEDTGVAEFIATWTEWTDWTDWSDIDDAIQGVLTVAREGLEAAKGADSKADMAQQTANDAQTLAQNAQSAADAAGATANNALGRANSGYDLASSAGSAAKAAKERADAAYALAEKISLSGGGSYELCEFYFFRSPVLREGFRPAQGGVVQNAATLYPKAWAYLQTSEGKQLCVTEAQWQAMTTASWATLADGSKVGWNGIGGAPCFVQNLSTGTLRLPDLRGMYTEAAGFDSLGVGGVHGDGVREIIGDFQSIGGNIYTASGCFKATYLEQLTTLTAGGLERRVITTIASSRVVPTANKNQPRAWGALACVYLG